MRRAEAWLVLAALALATILAFAATWPWLALLVAVALVALPRGRAAYAGFLAVGVGLNVSILALAVPGDPSWRVGPASFSAEGAWLGLVGGLRLAAALGANLVILGRVGPARLVDALRLPPAATALVAAVLLSAHDVGADFARLRDARRLDGTWPDGRLARAREAARRLPALLVAAHARARRRQEALRLAGHGTRPWFVPVVAVAALAAAGRLAFLAFPNVALTYVVVFLGGLLFGPLAGAAGAALGMGVTDFLLTGFYFPAYVNAPAMALLGLVGGWLRSLDFEGRAGERAAGAMLAATVGILGTFLFSVASDLLTWLIVAQARAEALAPMLALGLAFNVVPALVNGVLFALSVGPTLRAFRAAESATPPRGPRGHPTTAPELPPEAPAPR